jgi:hypothetical protein
MCSFAARAAFVNAEGEGLVRQVLSCGWDGGWVSIDLTLYIISCG